MTILKEQVEVVLNSARENKLAEAYYSGNVNETFGEIGSAKLRKAIRATQHHGQHNYCRVITDAVLHRTEIAGVIADKPTAQKKLEEVWNINELDLEANEIHRTAFEYGNAFAFVWPDENGDLLVSYNSPRVAGIKYDPENPRKKLYAVKIWKQSENETRLNVYTEDRISKFKADVGEYTEGTNWTAIGSEDNPFEEIPVFHFRTSRPFGKPEHFEAYGVQNDINKLLATHMFTVDYQGAPQRYALAYGEQDAVDFNDNDTERENMNRLRSNPGDIWYMKGVNTVGELQPADPEVFWKPIGKLKQSMAALTDTPYHLLERDITPPSGDALRVSEAPLMKKVKDRQTSFAMTWVELFKFILKVEGFPKAELEVKWKTVESMDDLNLWDVSIKKLNAGLSKRQVLKEMGYTDEEIDRIFEEKAAESAAAMPAFDPTNPQAATSTNDNKDMPVNGATDASKKDGGHPTAANTNTADAAKKSSAGQVN